MFEKFLRRLLVALLMFLGAGLLVSVLLAILPDAYVNASFGSRVIDNSITFIIFDYEMKNNLPMGEVLLSASTKSMILILGSLCLTALLAIPLAIWGARNPHNRLAKSLLSVVHAVSSVPVLIWSLLLLTFTIRFFNKLPIYDMLDSSNSIWTLMIYLLPILCLSFGDGMLSDIIRIIRAETVQVLDQDYIRAVRARNVSLNRHISRSLLIPIVSTFSSKIAYLISGTVVVEYVFNWRGLGFEILNAITTQGQKEYGLILAATMLFVSIVILLNFVNEMIAVLVDPRIQK